jgi:YesN/AraC family two-component response regulator
MATYPQYALRAFGVNSVDYLLKPMEPESLDRALKKVERLRGSGQLAQPDLQALIKKLTDSLYDTRQGYLDRIALAKTINVSRSGVLLRDVSRQANGGRYPSISDAKRRSTDFG